MKKGRKRWLILALAVAVAVVEVATPASLRPVVEAASLAVVEALVAPRAAGEPSGS